MKVFPIIGLVVLNLFSVTVFSLLSVLYGQVYEVSSNGMLPTFKPGNLYFIEKFSPYLNKPFEHGEIVNFYPEYLDASGKNAWQKFLLAIERLKGSGTDKAYFRRVAGLPGDMIELYCNNAKIVFPDNVMPAKATSPSGGETIRIQCRLAGESETTCVARYLVPPGFLFLIGDSTDYMGFVEMNKVFGRVQFNISNKFEIIEPQGSDKFIINVESPKIYEHH